jgi:prevent-host-death family protein
MARYVSSEQARASFPDLLAFTAETSQPVIIEDGERRVAVLISPADFDRLTASLRQVVERVRARNVDWDPDEAERLIAESVDDVRRERHAQQRPLAESRR